MITWQSMKYYLNKNVLNIEEKKMKSKYDSTLFYFGLNVSQWEALSFNWPWYLYTRPW